MIEIYEYEKFYSYNHPPLTRSASPGSLKEGPRRVDNLYRARALINRLVIANTDYQLCAPRFVTFTFADNITSLKEAHVFWGSFIRKLKIQFPQIKYLAVVEFQKRGAVHYHVLFFNLPYKKGMKKNIHSLWGKGFIKFKSAKHIENIEHLGLYLSKYLQKEIMDMRLRGEKAFFGSKNLTRPVMYRDAVTCGQMKLLASENNSTVTEYQSTYFGLIKKITIKL